MKKIKLLAFFISLFFAIISIYYNVFLLNYYSAVKKEATMIKATLNNFQSDYNYYSEEWSNYINTGSYSINPQRLAYPFGVNNDPYMTDFENYFYLNYNGTGVTTGEYVHVKVISGLRYWNNNDFGTSFIIHNFTSILIDHNLNSVTPLVHMQSIINLIQDAKEEFLEIDSALTPFSVFMKGRVLGFSTMPGWLTLPLAIISLSIIILIILNQINQKKMSKRSGVVTSKNIEETTINIAPQIINTGDLINHSVCAYCGGKNKKDSLKCVHCNSGSLQPQVIDTNINSNPTINGMTANGVCGKEFKVNLVTRTLIFAGKGRGANDSWGYGEILGGDWAGYTFTHYKGKLWLVKGSDGFEFEKKDVEKFTLTNSIPQYRFYEILFKDGRKFITKMDYKLERIMLKALY